MNQIIFRFLNNFALRHELTDTLIIFVADWLIWWMVFIVIALIFLKKISWRFGCYVIIASVFAWALTEVFQLFYSSPRPFLVLDNVRLLFAHGAYDSFPSGTTAFAFAIAVALYLGKGIFNKKISALFFVGAFLIGLSRVMVGIHWPVDILAGCLFGIIVAISIHKIILQIQEKLAK